MRMKSIRIDFPADGALVGEADLRNLLQAALMMGGRQEGNGPSRRAIFAVASACQDAGIDEYDDLREKNGGTPMVGPVFYIP